MSEVLEKVRTAQADMSRTGGHGYAGTDVRIKKCLSSPRCTVTFRTGRKCKLACMRITPRRNTHFKPDVVEYTRHCRRHGGKAELATALRKKAEELIRRSAGTLEHELSTGLGVASKPTAQDSNAQSARRVVSATGQTTYTHAPSTNPKGRGTSLHKRLSGPDLPTQSPSLPTLNKPLAPVASDPPRPEPSTGPTQSDPQPPEPSTSPVSESTPSPPKQSTPSPVANQPPATISQDLTNANLPVRTTVPSNSGDTMYTIHDKTLAKYFSKKLAHKQSTTLHEELALIRAMIQKLLNSIDLTNDRQLARFQSLVRDADRLARTVDRIESTRHVQYSRETLRLHVMQVVKAIKDTVVDPNIKLKLAKRLSEILRPALTDTGDIEITRETFSSTGGR